MTDLRILIADDETPARYGMAKALGRAGYEISEAADGRAALEVLHSGAIDLVFLDLNMPLLDGCGVLRELAASGIATEIIVVTAQDSVAKAVECMRLGAADYLTKPYEIEQIRAIARRVVQRRALERQVGELQDRLENKTAHGAMVGTSRSLQDLLSLVARAAKAPVDILIRGETGTGKELIAREIHRLSPRASGPFVAVNTAAIAESLAESELFGHVRGAFTGADRDRQGVFEQAKGGTLFLDEIGDMPKAAQTKILRALQERVVQPVGSTRQAALDVRVITATHQDLNQAISDGHFRQDLYFRIKGVELVVPPLRERREDILLLAGHFLNRQAARAGRPGLQLAADAADRLLTYHWPGNVRELEQLIASAAALAASDTIRAADLNLQSAEPTTDTTGFASLLGLPLMEAKAQLVDSFECTAITAALDQHQGNVSAAARQLGLHRQSLQQKMSQLGIARKSES